MMPEAGIRNHPAIPIVHPTDCQATDEGRSSVHRGLILAHNGDLITVNADSINQGNPPVPSDVIELTPGGTFVRQFSVDPNLGSGFAILEQFDETVGEIFAYVDDFLSNVTVWNISQQQED